MSLFPINKIVTSLHVVFNEVIPDPTTNYFSQLERLYVEDDKVEKYVDDFEFLLGLPHLDDEDGLVYVTTHAVQQRGYIVAYRRLRTGHGVKTCEEKVTPHSCGRRMRMTKTLSSPGMVSSEEKASLPDADVLIQWCIH